MSKEDVLGFIEALNKEPEPMGMDIVEESLNELWELVWNIGYNCGVKEDGVKSRDTTKNQEEANRLSEAITREIVRLKDKCGEDY